jgi:hypothetical protein
MKRFILSICILASIYIANAQDSSRQVQRRNIIKLDITSRFLYRNALVVSFERTVRSNQSFSVTAGYQEFPTWATLGEGIAVKDDRKRYGSKFGAEYRFYLKKENKYLAPRGVYIGPYFTFLDFKNERILQIDNNGTLEEAALESKLSIFNVGVQLGYQFVIKSRWVIDLVLVGPSVSRYNYKVEFNSDVNFDKEDIQNEIILDLLDRFPFLNEVVTDKEATRKGKLDTWAYGYRYQLQIGYHFGRKK